MATTPPPTRARTPPTPLHGPRYDMREAISPRRSSRINAREKLHVSSIDSALSDGHSPPLHSIIGVPIPRKRTSHRSSVQDASPPTSPFGRSDKEFSLGSHHPGTMLPTPVKTPRKRGINGEAKISTTARVLFPSRSLEVDDIMPTPRRSRKGKKHTAFRLDDLEGIDENGSGIQVYTDSRDRVPEVDETEENPFLVKKGSRARPSRNETSTTRNSIGEIKHGMTKDIDEAVENGEGMVYVFRGKKIFRKFDDNHPSQSATSSEDLGDLAIHRRAGISSSQRLTRSSIKPRLLFPPAKEYTPEPHESDEEAMTDIEGQDHGAVTDHEDIITTPVKQKSFMSTMTPPTTGRKPRRVVANLFPRMESPPPRVRGKTSPFDSWQRTKPTLGSDMSGKRSGEPIERQGTGSGKRTRSGEHASG